VLDVLTIIVLGSGLYLWWARRSPSGAKEAGREIDPAGVAAARTAAQEPVR
jgi:uncharacterized iron-regulated membrane protein